MDYVAATEPTTVSEAFRPRVSGNAVFQSPSDEDIAIGKGNASFDAIFQFREGYLTEQLRHSLSGKGHVLEKTHLFSDAAMSIAAKKAVELAVNDVNAHAAGGPGGTDDYRAHSIRIRLLHPTLHLTVGDPDKEGRVDWVVAVDLLLVRGTDLATPGEYAFTETPFARGRLSHHPSLQSKKLEASHRLWAQLEFAATAHEISGTDPLFADLLQVGFVPNQTLAAAIADALAPIQGDTLRVTPQMCLAGELHAGEALKGFAAFDVFHVIKTHDKGQILCLCIDATIGVGGGGLGLVRPFLNQSRFAWFFSQPLLEAIVALRWKRPATLRKFSAETSVPLADPNNKKKTVYGKAKVRWRWTGLSGAFVAHTPAATGAVRLKTRGELTLLKLWNQDGKKVDPDDYPKLFKTVEQGQVVDFELFETGKDKTQDAVKTLGHQLFLSLYRPTVKPLPMTGVTGVLSGAVRGGIARGELGTEGP